MKNSTQFEFTSKCIILFSLCNKCNKVQFNVMFYIDERTRSCCSDASIFYYLPLSTHVTTTDTLWAHNASTNINIYDIPLLKFFFFFNINICIPQQNSRVKNM